MSKDSLSRSRSKKEGSDCDIEYLVSIGYVEDLAADRVAFSESYVITLELGPNVRPAGIHFD
jgi:hypothetical protein